MRQETKILPFNWFYDGNCSQTPGSYLALTAELESERKRAAKNHCHDCRVKTECLGYGIITDRQGFGISAVYGGLISNQRQKLSNFEKNLAINALLSYKSDR
ncbi:WhiB family transcriptional regulator [Candidatus Saccharibacteria bacterium]|jgi:hypothetical protein|nr:WhiB family transcriptional regulator [Candidatus Saccharibacteria bacterium]